MFGYGYGYPDLGFRGRGSEGAVTVIATDGGDYFVTDAGDWIITG